MLTNGAIMMPMEQYGTRITQNSWSNSFKLGRPSRTRPRCANLIRTVLKTKVKKAVLLKKMGRTR